MRVDTTHVPSPKPETPEASARRRQRLAMLVGLAAWGWDSSPPPTTRVGVRRQQPIKACLLPGCAQLTTHRGGYCCPAHKHAHRTQTKALHCGPRTPAHGPVSAP